jgi:hypothetical protein
VENQAGPSIKINNIIVNTMDTNSGILTGENDQPFWKAHGKSNYGFGKIMGQNFVSDQINIVMDRDTVDHTIYSAED